MRRSTNIYNGNIFSECLCTSEVVKRWGEPPPGGAVGHLVGGGGALVDCMWDIFILNVIWAQDTTYILVGTLLVEILYSPLSTGTGSEL
jgi:hypothetical protein